MQPSLQKFPRTSPKVSNILVRHSCSTQVKPNGTYQHPETPYIMKYAPKYYHSLTLEVTLQSSLLSKVKKIKKLKTFKGLFKDPLPEKLLVNLLGNTRKEIEELPLIICTKQTTELGKSFWRELNRQKIKSFSNLKKILQPKICFRSLHNKFDDLLLIKEDFVRYLRNIRTLKSLKIYVNNANSDQAAWFFEELNEMNKVLGRLEVLAIGISYSSFDMEELLFKNTKVLSHLTDLKLSGGFDPVFADIPQVCKNLKSLTLSSETDLDEYPEVLVLLASIDQLEKLIRFKLDLNGLNGEVKGYWRHFRPQSSLRSLKLVSELKDLVSDELFEGEMAQTVIVDWEDIENLDFLGLRIFFSDSDSQEFLVVKSFITKLLKKVRKLRELKIWVIGPLPDDGSLTHGSFEIDEVAHLYESLEKFKFSVTNENRETGYPHSIWGK